MHTYYENLEELLTDFWLSKPDNWELVAAKLSKSCATGYYLTTGKGGTGARNLMRARMQILRTNHFENGKEGVPVNIRRCGERYIMCESQRIWGIAGEDIDDTGVNALKMVLRTTVRKGRVLHGLEATVLKTWLWRSSANCEKWGIYE